MHNPVSIDHLIGFSVQASDGAIGHVDDFYFHETDWAIRYVVVDLGRWLPGRKVLLAPGALSPPRWERRTLPVDCTRRQIETSPPIDTDKPVTRQHEIALGRHFGWELYWMAEALLGATDRAAAALNPIPENENLGGKPFDAQLYSVRGTRGFHVQALDGAVGHLSDYLLIDSPWRIVYLMVDTGVVLGLAGKKVLLRPRWTTRLDWAQRSVGVGLSQAQIRTWPEYHPGQVLDGALARRLDEHFAGTDAGPHSPH
jgi:hypothetical protein